MTFSSGFKRDHCCFEESNQESLILDIFLHSRSRASRSPESTIKNFEMRHGKNVKFVQTGDEKSQSRALAQPDSGCSPGKKRKRSLLLKGSRDGNDLLSRNSDVTGTFMWCSVLTRHPQSRPNLTKGFRLAMRPPCRSLIQDLGGSSPTVRKHVIRKQKLRTGNAHVLCDAEREQLQNLLLSLV